MQSRCVSTVLVGELIQCLKYDGRGHGLGCSRLASIGLETPLRIGASERHKVQRGTLPCILCTF